MMLLVLLTLLTPQQPWQHPEIQRQVSGLFGYVVDPAGAALPGVTVRITDLGSGEARTVKTDRDGYYAFDCLDEGVYELRFISSSFLPSVVGPITYKAGGGAEIDQWLNLRPLGRSYVSSDCLVILKILDSHGEKIEGVRAFIDGSTEPAPRTSSRCGQLPIGVSPDRHQVVLRREGFQAKVVTIDPSVVEVLQITVRMQRASGGTERE